MRLVLALLLAVACLTCGAPPAPTGGQAAKRIGIQYDGSIAFERALP